MKNLSLRLKAKGSGVSFWMIAKEMGVSESTLTRMMREDLPAEKKAEILSVIKKLKGGEQE